MPKSSWKAVVQCSMCVDLWLTIVAVRAAILESTRRHDFWVIWSDPILDFTKIPLSHLAKHRPGAFHNTSIESNDQKIDPKSGTLTVILLLTEWQAICGGVQLPSHPASMSLQKLVYFYSLEQDFERFSISVSVWRPCFADCKRRYHKSIVPYWEKFSYRFTNGLFTSQDRERLRYIKTLWDFICLPAQLHWWDSRSVGYRMQVRTSSEIFLIFCSIRWFFCEEVAWMHRWCRVMLSWERPQTRGRSRTENYMATLMLMLLLHASHDPPMVHKRWAPCSLVRCTKATALEDDIEY